MTASGLSPPMNADRVLRLLFSDRTVGDVDFSSERWTGALEPLNDPE